MSVYLIALEVAPVEMGKVYEGLPLHCTLVHWFAADSIRSIITAIRELSKDKGLLYVDVEDEAQFTGMTAHGPVPVTVNKVRKAPELARLHGEIVKILSGHGATFTMPQYLGDGYEPHITHQQDSRAWSGERIKVSSLFLAEAKSAAYGSARTIRDRFEFDSKEIAI